MKLSPLEQRITTIIAPVVADCGLSLVCVRITGESGGTTLLVMAENAETRNLGVEDCAKLSREVAAILDVEDPINGRYRLEVSSPGIDRPLMNAKDFVDFTGFEAKAEIFPPIDGQKRFRGYLRGVEGNVLDMETETGPVKIDLSSIQKARLVLTDELLARMKELQPEPVIPTEHENTEALETTEESKNGTATGR